MKQLGLRRGSRREPWLDLLRGLAVAGMVLVNNPGSWSATYWPLAHAEWHGLTPADVIFPLFLFIVGIAIVYAPSLAIPCKADTSVYVGLFTRSAVLFGLGVLLVGFPRYDLETLRVTGVLQRIAICYLFAAILFLNTGWRIHLATAVAILFGYFVLLISIPPPGCHSGSLSKECNLASYVDRSILGKRAGAGTHDPEGLLSTLPAAATTLLGMLAGQWLRTQASDCQKIIWLALAGLCGIALGWIWHRWFPVNKSLWTSSYVLATAGVSSIFLALCYAMRTPAQWWRPIQVLGASALAAFVASEVGSRLLALEAWHGLPQRGGHSLQNHLYEWLLSSGSEPKLASLVYALGYLGVVLLLATIVGRSVCARRL